MLLQCCGWSSCKRRLDAALWLPIRLKQKGSLQKSHRSFQFWEIDECLIFYSRMCLRWRRRWETKPVLFQGKRRQLVFLSFRFSSYLHQKLLASTPSPLVPNSTNCQFSQSIGGPFNWPPKTTWRNQTFIESFLLCISWFLSFFN